MDFDLSSEQRLLQEQARALLAARCPLERRRALIDGGAPWDAELWQAIAELGWLGAGLPEAGGGVGPGYVALAVLAEELGRALAPVPFVPSAGVATEALRLAGSSAQRGELSALITGTLVGTFVLAAGARRLDVRLADGRLSGTMRAVPYGDSAHRCVVLAGTAAGPCLAWADLTAAEVERARTACLDPSRPCATLAFHDAPAEPLGPAGAGRLLADRLLDGAAVLLAFEQLGAATRAFETTKQYTMERYVFGRPVASFQALKHRLVDVFVGLELARSSCLFGAWALGEGAPELGRAAWPPV
jgi:alkylation response protein AidB-like acyl-CoA dehydrogenase